MFTINEDNSIYVTRGDIVFFRLTAEELKDDTKVTFKFIPGDLVRIKIYDKKGCDNVVLQKDIIVTEETEEVPVFLTEEDTKLGDVINKPKDYWFEAELNPDTNPQTLVGYDEEGPRLFKLFPEGADLEVPEVDPEVVKVMDDELDLTSHRPVENQAIARAIVKLRADTDKTMDDVAAGKARLDNPPNGTTEKRPTDSDFPTGHIPTGYMYFDMTLGKPIWRNSNGQWVDANGTVV